MKEVDPDTLKAWLEGGEAVLIDVRESHEYGAERIPGALLCPLSAFEPRRLPEEGNKRVVFHCGTGRRSAAAVQKCVEAGVPLRTHLAGGLAAWKRAGFAVLAANPSTGTLQKK
jgi:rhodanese-related sulfurtransferase